MGVEPRWKGLATSIPVVMVSKRVYGILVGESYSGTPTHPYTYVHTCIYTYHHHDHDHCHHSYLIHIVLLYVGAKIAFKENTSVNSTEWEALEKYWNGEGRFFTYRTCIIHYIHITYI